MGNNHYAFGAGGFKLGDRVEILTTGQRGIIMGECIHLSGCNTYSVLLPNVTRYEKKLMKSCDHLILRKLEANESVFGKEDNLTDEAIYSPKGTDVNAEWITAALLEGEELIPEVDEAIGVEEITIKPGTKVLHKAYNIPMLVVCICRELHSKELEYFVIYMDNDKEIMVAAHAYTLIPIEQQININLDNDDDGKTGPMFGNIDFGFDERFSGRDLMRYGGSE